MAMGSFNSSGAQAPMAEINTTTLQVSIDADGNVLLAGEVVSRPELESRFRDAVVRDARVEMHLMADRATRYEAVAETMSAARRAGLGKIGFVTQPVAGTP